MEVVQTSSSPDIIGLLIIILAIGGIALVIAGLLAYSWKFLVGWIKYKDREQISL